MAIYIIDGKPGSGKTYFSVSHVLRKFYKYDSLIDEYVPRDSVYIISNIDSLKLDHVDFENLMSTFSLEQIFNIDYIRSLREKHRFKNCVFILDDCQKWFHSKYYDKDVFYFFQYHRHEGVDLYLIVQDMDTLPKQIKSLSEYTIHAVSRTLGSGFSFRYKYIDGREVLKNKILTSDKKVFALYKSMNWDEIEKPRPIIYRYVVIFLVLALTAGFGFKFLFIDSFLHRNKPINNPIVSTVPSSSPASLVTSKSLNSIPIRPSPSGFSEARLPVNFPSRPSFVSMERCDVKQDIYIGDDNEKIVVCGDTKTWLKNGVPYKERAVVSPRETNALDKSQKVADSTPGRVKTKKY